MNRLIAFEGIEGSGKTTQIRMAGGYLEKKGAPFIITGEPGGTPLGEKIRDILLNRGPFPVSARAELLLFLAARAQHVKDVILPAQEARKWVLCDRFLAATLAYQGCGRGFDRSFIQLLHDFASDCLKPALTILLDLPVETGLTRAGERIARIQGAALEDSFERETLEFHQKVREGYLALAGDDYPGYRIIDASRDIRTIHREVCEALDAIIDG